MNQAKAIELIDRLLKSEIGRQAISRRLNVQFETKEEAKTESDRPVVAVLVPCYDHPEPEMSNALAEMLRHSRETGVCEAYVPPNIIGSSVVHWSRNYLIAELIKRHTPWTHVLFIDDDIVPPGDTLARLLTHGKDIVGAVCTKRIDPPIPNIRFWDEQQFGFKEIFDCPWDTLMEVGGIGTGCMLISRKALEMVADAWFRCLYEREVYKLTEERTSEIMEARLRSFDDSANAQWFRFLPEIKGATQEYGEDMSFCLMAKRYCGIQVYADTSIKPKHIGKYGYSVHDYMHYKDEVIAKAKERGTYSPLHAAKIERPAIEVIDDGPSGI